MGSAYFSHLFANGYHLVSFSELVVAILICCAYDQGAKQLHIAHVHGRALQEAIQYACAY